MVGYVIDTNVAIVANGSEVGVTVDCRLAAVKLLVRAYTDGKIFLDSAGEIQLEYRRYLSPKGAPGVGDRFYLEVLNSHPDRIVRVDVPRRPDGHHEDLPQPIIDAGFDPSDRVFAAVAKKTQAKVFNAVDTDWVHHRDVIESNGIKVEFLCGCDPTEWRD